MLAHSRDDELVEWEQVELMEKALLSENGGGFRRRDGTGKEEEEEDGRESTKGVTVLELRGKHDQIWEEGGEMARAVSVTLEKVLMLRN